MECLGFWGHLVGLFCSVVAMGCLGIISYQVTRANDVTVGFIFLGLTLVMLAAAIGNGTEVARQREKCWAGVDSAEVDAYPNHCEFPPDGGVCEPE